MMIEISDKKNCSGCEACLNICPVNCITMDIDEEGFRYPKVDKSKCINCHLCEKICPIINNKISNNKGYLVFGATNKNKNILKRSTSGGVFFELGKKIIVEKQGVVFGVKFDGENNAVFDFADNLNDLKNFLGSKYVQAKVNESFKKAKKFLSEGRTVLFSGAPCQIAGLKSYLGRDYENLYTCDFVCEGVTNDLLLDAFKNHYEIKYNSKIMDIRFRYKKYGWMYFGLYIKFENGRKIYIPRNEANYLNIFYSLIYNRPSCYECHFRELKSGSDFKLADFWKVNESKSGKYCFYGVSHFLINTKKGEIFFESLKEKFYLEKSNVDEIKRLNGTFNTQKFSNDKKKIFLKEIDGKSKEEIFDIMNLYIDCSIINKLKMRIKMFLVKIKYTIFKHK